MSSIREEGVELAKVELKGRKRRGVQRRANLSLGVAVTDDSAHLCYTYDVIDRGLIEGIGHGDDDKAKQNARVVANDPLIAIASEDADHIALKKENE